MNLRIAKKIRRDAHVFLYDSEGNRVRALWNSHKLARAENRLNRHKGNSPKGKIFKDTLRLVRHLAANPEDSSGIMTRWKNLRARIIEVWNPDCWVEEEYLRGLHLNSEREISNFALIYDLSYYSDRWCDRRVGCIDKQLSILFPES